MADYRRTLWHGRLIKRWAIAMVFKPCCTLEFPEEPEQYRYMHPALDEHNQNFWGKYCIFQSCLGNTHVELGRRVTDLSQ